MALALVVMFDGVSRDRIQEMKSEMKTPSRRKGSPPMQVILRTTPTPRSRS